MSESEQKWLYVPCASLTSPQRRTNATRQIIPTSRQVEEALFETLFVMVDIFFSLKSFLDLQKYVKI